MSIADIVEESYQRHVDNVAFGIECDKDCPWCKEQREYEQRGDLCAEE